MKSEQKINLNRVCPHKEVYRRNSILSTGYASKSIYYLSIYLLFLLFINDLPQTIEFCNILLFADDIKLFLEISNEEDCQKMQSDWNKITNWCNTNKALSQLREMSLTIIFSLNILLLLLIIYSQLTQTVVELTLLKIGE